MKRSDPIQYFCVRFVKEDVGNYLTKDAVYNYYVKLCHKLRHKPISKNWFSSKFRIYTTYADDDRIYNDDNKQVRVWKGITIDLELLDDVLNDDQQDAKTEKTMFPNYGINSGHHVESENNENASLSSHKAMNQTEVNENTDKNPLCIYCKKPISELKDLTNKDGVTCHKSCKSKHSELTFQLESILNPTTTNVKQSIC